MLAHMYSTCAR